MLFWHPSGAPTGTYYFGTQLVDAKDPQWDSVVAWVDALQDKFSNVYVPWTSHQPSMWRVCSLSVTLAEQLKDETEERFRMDREARSLERTIALQGQQIEDLKHQLKIATDMLQKEWDDTPKSSTTTTAAWMAPTPKMPPTGAPSSASSVARLL